ncbi:MAG: hypothetical protein IKS19_06375 [Clostridia bacterium]|nr:hypothetical protein [Clostridia bacterium]
MSRAISLRINTGTIMHNIQIIGNDGCLELIGRWRLKNEFPQAILINGAAGSGRATVARYIAQAAVCRHNNRPCGECADCRRVFDGVHPDFTIVSKENDGFKLENIRNLRTNALIRPNEADRRVILIKDAQELSVGAQNALLKIIEEPPAFLIFIFTCIEDKKLLDTIQSRCVALNTAPVKESEAVPYLMRSVRGLAEFPARQAINRSGGNIGRAMEMLTGKPSRAQDLAEQMGRAIMLRDELLLMRICAKTEKDRGLYEQTLRELLSICRDVLVIKSGGSATTSGMINLAEEMAKRMSAKRLCAVIEAAEKLLDYSKKYMNNTLLLSLTSSELTG